MKYTVLNLSRHTVRNISRTPRNSIWISIEEPGTPSSSVDNRWLEGLPTLRIAFDDISTVHKLFNGVETVPFSMEMAKEVITFILNNPRKNIIVNCAAGISRSAAIAKFCHHNLGYKWWEEGQMFATPNTHVIKMLSSANRELNEKSNEKEHTSNISSHMDHGVATRSSGS